METNFEVTDSETAGKGQDQKPITEDKMTPRALSLD
jgi:hypothetical protein